MIKINDRVLDGSVILEMSKSGQRYKITTPLDMDGEREFKDNFFNHGAKVHVEISQGNFNGLVTSINTKNGRTTMTVITSGAPIQ